MYTPYDGKFRISNPYNKPNHNGLDMVGYTSKKIYAVAGGMVEVADDKGTLDPNGFGVYVRIAVSGKDKTYDYYGHMVKDSLTVKVGEIVKQGQIIGTEGNTGQSTGNHLHFERRVGGYGRECAVNVAEVLGIENKEGVYITDDSKNKTSTSTVEKTLVKQAQHTITATKTVDEDKLLAETTKLKTLGFNVSSKEVSAAVYEIKSTPKTELKVGDKVTVKVGSKSASGVGLARFLSDKKEARTIMSISGDNATIGKDGIVTATTSVDNLVKV